MPWSSVIAAVRELFFLIGASGACALRAFSEAAAPVAVTALWQGILVASCLAVVLLFVPRISAQHRFLLCSAACMALVSLPFLSLLSKHSAFATAPGTSNGLSAVAAHPWLQLDQRWSLLIASLWIVASAILAIDLVLHSLRLRKLWTRAIPTDAQVPAAESLNPTGVIRRRTTQICTTQDLDRPSVIGFLAPRILIPDWLFARLTPAELHQIILHETEHLRRFDDWSNLFQKLCLVFFPLNPALWWIERRLSKEREMACDEAVIRITRAPRAYAACLASLAERGLARREEALSLGAWQRRSELVHRVHSILRRNRLMHPAAARVLLAAIGCSLLAVTVELARCPQLVAFVPSARANPAGLAINGQSSKLGDAVYSANPRQLLSPGVHAILAKAEMPAAPIAQPSANRTRQHDTNLKTAAAGEPRPLASEPGVRAHNASTRDNKHAAEAPQQLIVFTAWEQVETSALATQTVADYDTAPAPDNSTASKVSGDASAKSDTSKPAKDLTPSHLTVTRLIFRIVPADSSSAQPTTIPMGWFVIQL
jgi:beta-lactamase regulating signal transducer with metallopeptidase domain